MIKIFFVKSILISFLFSQSIEISGIVFDNHFKTPLEGVNVFSNKVGTVTNENGKFILLVDSKSEIIFSFIHPKSPPLDAVLEML